MPQEYSAVYTKRFQDDLSTLEKDIQLRILKDIEIKLLKDSHQYAKKLKGFQDPGVWKFRIDDYRVRFDMDGTTLIFHRVRHRREIYER